MTPGFGFAMKVDVASENIHIPLGCFTVSDDDLVQSTDTDRVLILIDLTPNDDVSTVDSQCVPLRLFSAVIDIYYY